jgi:hypothetical protein
MDKQPHSRMCFRDVFRVRHRPAHGAPSACTSPFTPTTTAAASPASGPSRNTRASPANCTGGSSARYWTSQLKFQCTLTLCRYD